MWKIKKNYLFHSSCVADNRYGAKGRYCSSPMLDTKCFACKEPIPDYIKLQIKLLDLRCWDYLFKNVENK